MVFNWFRRKFDKSESESDPVLDAEQVEESAVDDDEPVKQEATELEIATEEVATDYLAWAKAAYQNIQQQQQESAPSAVVETEPETASSELESVAVETANPELLVAEVATSDNPGTTAADSEPAIIVDNPATETSIDAPEDPAVENIPIWARDDRQQRLQQLKASAIETVEPAAPATDLELDDDFLWSAKVLADRGRTPEQVSLDEINWLKKLRQGLDKTRRGFVNQLKALIGQGPLNAEAVESIETLLLQADVGVEATDYVIETLQAKLRQESLPHIYGWKTRH